MWQNINSRIEFSSAKERQRMKEDIEKKAQSVVLENFPQTDSSTTINHFSQLPKLFYTWIQNELCSVLAPKANDEQYRSGRKWKIYEQLFGLTFLTEYEHFFFSASSELRLL